MKIERINAIAAGKSFTMEEAQELRDLAQLGARVLEILGKAGTVNSVALSFREVCAAARSLGLLDEKGGAQ